MNSSKLIIDRDVAMGFFTQPNPYLMGTRLMGTRIVTTQWVLSSIGYTQKTPARFQLTRGYPCSFNYVFFFPILWKNFGGKFFLRKSF